MSEVCTREPWCPRCKAPVVEATTYADLGLQRRVYVYGVHERDCDLPDSAKVTIVMKERTAYHVENDLWVEVAR